MTKELSMWTVVPTRVRKSKVLTAEEKEMYYAIADGLTAGGYCKETNEDLAKRLPKVTARTVQDRIKSLENKRFLFIRKYGHFRLLYLNIPGEPEDQPMPTEEELQLKTEAYQESLKKAIVFGTIEFPVLVDKLLESPYLEHVQDNTRQFLLTEKQIEFLAEFKKLAPGKKIDCQVACYPNVDYDKLMDEMRHSKFLAETKNLSLKWLLENSEEIIARKYENFAGRFLRDKPTEAPRAFREDGLLARAQREYAERVANMQ